MYIYNERKSHFKITRYSSKGEPKIKSALYRAKLRVSIVPTSRII
jgi:hypothetical protein